MTGSPASPGNLGDGVRRWPPVPFDPELSAFLELIPDMFRSNDNSDDRAQRISEVLDTRDEELLAGGFTVEHHTATAPDGADVPLILVRPADAVGPLPVLYTIHGGGMVMGTYRQGLGALAKGHARESGCAIVSVEYRLAPAHPHPVPVEDCYAGLVWTAEHGADLGLDTERVIVFGGSAGGGLAAAVALMCRDRRGPHLIGQMLMCPMLDDRNDTPSAHQMRGLGIWDQEANHAGWTALLGDRRGRTDVSPYAAPARATDLSGLPPAFIEVGSAETFRDEDVAYATAIWQAGGSAELHVWPGGFHGFSMAEHTAIAQDASIPSGRWLRRILGR